jgi:hypothetical protein
MARIGSSSLKESRAGRTVVRLAVVLFALRALIPVGYMPDLGGLQEGQVQIVICTGTGTQALLVDAAGQPLDEDQTPDHAGAADCFFATAAATAFVLPATAPTLARPAFASGEPAGRDALALVPPVQGPPLGPRAPPVLLG